MTDNRKLEIIKELQVQGLFEGYKVCLDIKGEPFRLEKEGLFKSTNSGEVLDVLELYCKNNPYKYADWIILNYNTTMKLTDRIWNSVDFILKEQPCDK